MTCLQALVIGRQRQPPIAQSAAFLLRAGEVGRQSGSVGKLEILRGELPLGAPEDIAIGKPTRAADAVEVEIKNILDALNIHR